MRMRPGLWIAGMLFGCTTPAQPPVDVQDAVADVDASRDAMGRRDGRGGSAGGHGGCHRP